MTSKKYILERPKSIEKLEGFLQSIFRKNPNKHYIIKIETAYIPLENLLNILHSNQKKIEQFRANKSLVLLTEDYSYDELPEFISVAPTEEEAVDIIEFEEIERDLGF